MITIQEGDVLVIGTKKYPIVKCPVWEGESGMNTAGFQRDARVAYSVERTVKGSPSVIASGYCTYLDPVDPELRRRLALDTPHNLKQTFIASTDSFAQLILEDLKR
jgi:hypothetical protein